MFRPTLVVLLAAVMFTAIEGQEPPATAAQESRGAIAEDDHTGTKADLTEQNVESFHALIRPQPDEWRHLKVQWLTDVVAARKKAAEEDKPLVICYTGGAGYNEPLGVC